MNPDIVSWSKFCRRFSNTKHNSPGFWNYFQYGLDFLISPQFKVHKILCYSNIASHLSFYVVTLNLTLRVSREHPYSSVMPAALGLCQPLLAHSVLLPASPLFILLFFPEPLNTRKRLTDRKAPFLTRQEKLPKVAPVVLRKKDLGNHL